MYNYMESKSKKYQAEYNRKYYETHKNEILKKLAEKETCNICGKQVRHQNLPTHQQTVSCRGRAMKDPTILETLQQEIANRVTAEMKKMLLERQP
jgi:hypothetical protein